jgi:hypothetical protein
VVANEVVDEVVDEVVVQVLRFVEFHNAERLEV